MLPMVALLWLGCSLLWPVGAMRSDYLAQLRQDTVDMFYHGYSSYMEHAFPEDEVGYLSSDVRVHRKIANQYALVNYLATSNIV